MITIVDYGMGNLGSVLNMFKKVGAAAQITDSKEEIQKAQKILLPGVGAYDAAMERIAEKGFLEILHKKALEEKVPVLGICLGMQLLTERSEEGQLSGLGWIAGETKKFQFTDSSLKVPYMGWNQVVAAQASPLTKNLPEDARFYFVHSYYVETAKAETKLMRAHYGIDFDAMIWNGNNIFGAQFHPEKSHKFGMKLFENFAAL